MKIITTILRIRFSQLIRILRDIGWAYLLIFLPIAFVFMLVLLETARDHPAMLGLAGVLILLSLHLQRKDKRFISFLNIPSFVFCAAEYSVAVAPVSLLFLTVLGDWQDALLLHAGAVLVALLPLQIRHKQLRLIRMNLSWVPIKAIEWRGGLRKYGWFMLILYVFAYPLVGFTATVPLVMLLLAIFSTGFYDDIEGKELFEVAAENQSLLLHKVKMQFAVFHLAMTPLYMLFLLFHLSYWYILLAALVMVQILLCFAMFYKYANYAPFRTKLYNQTPVGIFFFCLLVPFFMPGVVIYCIYYGRKAFKNMKYYYATDQ